GGAEAAELWIVGDVSRSRRRARHGPVLRGGTPCQERGGSRKARPRHRGAIEQVALAPLPVGRLAVDSAHPALLRPARPLRIPRRCRETARAPREVARGSGTV